MKLSKTLQRRLHSAFNYAQKKCKTAYHFNFNACTPKDFVESGHGPEAIMAIRRTERGMEDESHFIIDVNLPVASARSMAVLRLDAGHEVIHAMLFDLYEKNNVKNLENAVYRLQRAFFGEENV